MNISSVVLAFILLMSLYGVNCQLDELFYDLQEERGPVVVIADLSTDSNVSSVLDSTEMPFLKFQLYSGPSRTNFRLNNLTGYLSAVERIDREAICRFQITCVIRLNVGIQSLKPGSSFFHTITVYINIEDINDNSPLFPEVTSNLAIMESAAIGSTYIIDGATDLDTGEGNSVQSYSLVPESPVFGIKTQRKLDGSIEVRLVIVAELDREGVSHYDVTVMAYDGGNPRKSGEMTLSINVTDVNDNWPQFTNTVYNASVNETTATNVAFTTVSATDADDGPNGQISYRFSSRQTDFAAVRYFGINSENGEIYPTMSLSPLQGQTKRIVIEATDSGSDIKVSQCIVQVTVLDNANNPPTIRINLLNENNTVEILESASIGSLVAHFVTSDKDSGQNGVVSCFVSNSSEFSVRQIKINQFKVVLSQKVDRETQSSHQMSLVCQDGGQPPLQTTVGLKVMLIDVNDNSPVFENNKIYLNVSENNENGLKLTTVRATDVDVEENGAVTYRLGRVSPMTSTIFVNQTTGDVIVLGSFDYESEKNVNITVIAEDGGVPPLSSSETLYLSIIDENDNSPYFDEPVYIFNIKENLASGQFVGKVKAKDDDSGVNGRLNYMLEQNSSLPFSFSNDGDLTTLKSFDREEKATYNFKVIAYDLSDSPKSSNVLVTVSILDQNDNIPTITYPRFSNHSVPTSYHTVPGTELLKVEAVDEDDGDNARILYEIKCDSRPNMFIIDQNSGSIFLNKQLRARDVGNVSVVVKVSDKGLEPKSSAISFTITITDGNLTALASSQGAQQNMLVVIALVSVTFVVAVIVLATVVFLKRTDQRKRALNRTKYDAKDISEPVFKKGGEVKSGKGELRKNDVEHHGKPFHGTQPTNEELIVFKMKLAEKYQVEGGDSSFSKETEISDVLSSASGETTGCDSGRGASECEGQDDIQGSVPNSPRKQSMTNKGSVKKQPSYYRLDQIKSNNSTGPNASHSQSRHSVNLTDSYKMKSNSHGRSSKKQDTHCDKLKSNNEKNREKLRDRSKNYDNQKQHLKSVEDNYQYLENNNTQFDQQHSQQFHHENEYGLNRGHSGRYPGNYRHSIPCSNDYISPKYIDMKRNSVHTSPRDIQKLNEEILELSNQRKMGLMNSFRNSVIYNREKRLDTDDYSVDTLDDGQSTTTSGSYTVDTDHYTDDIYQDSRYVTHLNHNPEDVFV